ncbi:MAG: glycosyltransferase [Candidatus Omnitrophica bacterium]|nr:glycosyltransferase [Candidatus Omnitrophota bacterium]
MMEILKKEYDIVYVTDDSWRGGAAPDLDEIRKINPSIIVFWQAIANPETMKKLRGTKVFVPMYDDVFVTSDMFWLQYIFMDLKVLCFCDEIRRYVNKYGLQTKYIKYYPMPNEAAYKKNNDEKINVIFWPRRNEISWDIVKALLGDAPIGKFYYRIFHDPGFMIVSDDETVGHNAIRLPSKEDVQKYHIQFVEGWLEKEEYFDMINHCNVFIGSRKTEGIGLSFLEAMARGICVVAPDLPIANEYIVNGYNGLLYDLSKPKPLDFTHIQTLRRNALKTIERGCETWEQEKNSILEFLKTGFSLTNICHKNYLLAGKLCFLNISKRAIDFIRSRVNLKIR